MAGPKPILTEFDIDQRLGSCVAYLLFFIRLMLPMVGMKVSQLSAWETWVAWPWQSPSPSLSSSSWLPSSWSSWGRVTTKGWESSTENGEYPGFPEEVSRILLRNFISILLYTRLEITPDCFASPGFFLGAFPAPRDPKSADFSSFHLEFWVFSLSFEFFPWVLTYFLMFFLQNL